MSGAKFKIRRVHISDFEIQMPWARILDAGAKVLEAHIRGALIAGRLPRGQGGGWDSRIVGWRVRRVLLKRPRRRRNRAERAYVMTIHPRGVMYRTYRKRRPGSLERPEGTRRARPFAYAALLAYHANLAGLENPLQPADEAVERAKEASHKVLLRALRNKIKFRVKRRRETVRF